MTADAPSAAGLAADWPAFDVHAARAATPGCRGPAPVAHFNHAGASLMPDVVVDRVVAHLRREAAIGGYEAAREVADERAAVYAAAAGLIGARADEIALTDSATRAFDTALWALDLQAGDRVLLTEVAYGSNALALLELRRRTGIELVVLPSEADGTVALDALAAELRRGAALVALTHAPTNGGLVQPAEAVGALCRQHGTIYLLDACQSVGQRVVDVAALGCDLLSATSRKYLRGPRGQGFLYVRGDLLPRLRPPMPDVGSATWTGPDCFTPAAGARRLECWEHDVAGRLGFGEALRLCAALGPAAIQARVAAVAETLRTLLAAEPGVTVTDRGADRSGIVTFVVDGHGAAEVQRALAADGVQVNVSDAESTLLDMHARGLSQVVRASVHYTSTVAELDRLLAGLRRLRSPAWSSP